MAADHGGETIIGLSEPGGGGSISLEPGGQFELSGAPLETVHETCEEVHQHLAQVREVGDELGIGFLGLGFSPLWTRAETPVMPKGRYAIMAPYMDRKGRLGRDMMFRSCTVQVNLDFGPEADMVKKLRGLVGAAAGGHRAVRGFAFTEGRPNGFKSFRSAVWLDTDPDRTGMLPFVFEPGFGFERYVDYALDVPMYFVARNGRYIDCAGESFRRFMEGRLPQLPGERPTFKDWGDHLTTIFPEVRLKRYLEMRGADSGQWRRLCALPALWTGVLYDERSLDGAYELIKAGAPASARRCARRCRGWRCRPRSPAAPVQEVAKDMLALSRAGLERRRRLGCKGRSEAQFLDVLDDIAETGRTRAEDLLDHYDSDWNGDVTRVFRDFAF